MTYYSVTILASDRYLHCLPGFAYLFNQYWSEFTPVIIFLAAPKATITPELPRNFSIVQVDSTLKNTWSKAARASIEQINDPLMILLLEDYFLDRPIDVRRIAALYEYMQRHEGIAKIDLTDDRLKVVHQPWESVGDMQMIRSADDAPFQTSLQAAIWRKEFFLRYLVDSESPWEYEKRGTKRMIADRKADLQQGVILGCAQPPLHYINAIGGEGNHPHQWAKKRFPVAMWSHLKGLGHVSEPG